MGLRGLYRKIIRESHFRPEPWRVPGKPNKDLMFKEIIKAGVGFVENPRFIF
jgi:hypothetical protein